MNYFNYFTEIEDTFVRRRGKHLFLSPLDWAMIEAWQERGIPLHIVLRSIEAVFDVFDKQPAGTRSIKSLFYCREEVEVQHKEWLESQTGSSSAGEAAESATGFSVDAVASHITSATETLKTVSADSLREDIGRAVARLDELAANLTANFETVDKTLYDIEKMLDRAMLTNWDKPHLKIIESEVAGQLRSYKADMEPAAYQTTHELMLLKKLREESGIPRLGLFYL
ncbi:MAG: hypothetical protein WKF34_04320 [Pyrinomonadaceae bacterium]